MSSAAAASAAAAAGGSMWWRIVPRPVLETVLKNYAAHHRVPNLLLLHGPRGSGKSSLVEHRLLDGWNSGSHCTAYVDFASPLKENSSATPWSAWSCAAPPAELPALRSLLERSLERLATHGVLLGAVGPKEVFAVLNRWHGIHHSLRCLLPGSSVSSYATPSVLWSRAVLAACSRVEPSEIAVLLQTPEESGIVEWSKEGEMQIREGLAALKVAKEVLSLQQKWRREAVREMNRTGRISRTLTHSATDWPCLLVDILSLAAEVDFFQPKLVLNNIDVLRKAIVADDSSVSAPLYHDSLIWRMVALALNERSLPVILVTSDGYYSYQASVDFGFPDILLSRETFGWTLREAKLHMVSDYFTMSEWRVIEEVLGSNMRQLCELYALKQSTYYQRTMHDGSSFEDLVDAYLSYLQVSVVKPAMESALLILQKFASDVCAGKVPASRLFFGAPWRHPPCKDDPELSLKWAKIQLMDFVQSLVKAEFGLNYLADSSLEILDDPSAVAMLEVGLLYTQRDPSFIRPITVGIHRCLIRWLVQEKMQMRILEFIPYMWQRLVRGRSYRHLMKEVGYK